DSAPAPPDSMVESRLGGRVLRAPRQRLGFGANLGRQPVAESGEELLLAGDGRGPLGGVDLQQPGQRLVAQIEAVPIERPRSGDGPDDGVGRLAPAFAPFQYPLQYPQVLAESGPEIFAAVIGPEPIAAKDLRRRA